MPGGAFDSIKEYDDNLEFEETVCGRCGLDKECVELCGSVHLCANCLRELADHLSDDAHVVPRKFYRPVVKEDIDPCEECLEERCLKGDCIFYSKKSK